MSHIHFNCACCSKKHREDITDVVAVAILIAMFWCTLGSQVQRSSIAFRVHMRLLVVRCPLCSPYGSGVLVVTHILLQTMISQLLFQTNFTNIFLQVGAATSMSVLRVLLSLLFMIRVVQYMFRTVSCKQFISHPANNRQGHLSVAIVDRSRPKA